MNKEQPQPDREQNEFPVPKKGTLDQITSELLVDRNDFIKQSLFHLRRENEPLYEAVLTETISSPQRDLALDWALMYYELNARPGRTHGPLIVRVSSETIHRMMSLQGRELQPILEQLEAMNPNSVQARKKQIELSEAMDRLESQDDGIRDADRQRSGEFAKFWGHFLLFRAQRLMENPESAKFDHESGPLKTISRALHEQIRTNQSKRNLPRI